MEKSNFSSFCTFFSFEVQFTIKSILDVARKRRKRQFIIVSNEYFFQKKVHDLVAEVK